MKHIIYLALLLITAIANAEVTLLLPETALATIAVNVNLTCQSSDGSVTIKGNLPGDMIESELTVTKDGTAVTFSQAVTDGEVRGDSVVLIDSPSQHIFAVSGQGRSSGVSKNFELIADPKLMNGEAGTSYRIEFVAKYSVFEQRFPCTSGCTMVGADPGHRIWHHGELNCRASYRMD